MTATSINDARARSNPNHYSLDLAAAHSLDAISERISTSQTSHAGVEFEYDIAIVGLGYVGLPTALAVHETGARVLGIDVDPARIASILSRTVDLLDRDRRRLGEALITGRFSTSDNSADIARAKVVVVCVPTPVDKNLQPDLSILRLACQGLVRHAAPHQTLILTSTTYVGCTRDFLVTPLLQRGFTVGSDIHVAFSPERIDPGNEKHAAQAVPRILGGATESCTREAAAALGSTASRLHVVSSPEAAEMTKLLENTFRAVNIAMINEFANACSTLDLDVMEVIAGAATKPYGFMQFLPGPGVGGHCIPCDPHYLLWQLREHRLQTPVIEGAMAGIAARPDHVVSRSRDVLDGVGRGLKGARVLVLGVAYKPDVEDVRESPALVIIDGLRAAGASVSYHDPLIPRIKVKGGHTLASTASPHRGEYDLVIVHTRHTGMNLSWLRGHGAVLDTTYSLTGLPDRTVL